MIQRKGEKLREKKPYLYRFVIIFSMSFQSLYLCLDNIFLKCTYTETIQSVHSLTMDNFFQSKTLWNLQKETLSRSRRSNSFIQVANDVSFCL